MGFFSFSFIYAVRRGMLYELRAKKVEEDLKIREITSHSSLNRHLQKCIFQVLVVHFSESCWVVTFATTVLCALSPPHCNSPL